MRTDDSDDRDSSNMRFFEFEGTCAFAVIDVGECENEKAL